MAIYDLPEWLDEFCNDNVALFVKRLSANDTGATGAHGAGPYLPKEFSFAIFPEIDSRTQKNPDIWIDLFVDSDPNVRTVRIIYYNSKFSDEKRNGRDEVRLTNLGGSASPLLDCESTGALAIFAFPLSPDGTAESCHVWLCRHETEEDMAEERLGPIEPGRFFMWIPGQSSLFNLFRSESSSCELRGSQIPPEWLSNFPSGEDIVRKTLEMRPSRGFAPDKRLMVRRDCEFEIFLSVENAIELPAIQAGFSSLADFVSKAHTILQRRKSRSGRSLELHVKEILVEENFVQNLTFDYGVQSDPNRRPDFLFPSQAAYRDPNFPSEKLRMLATKTTCKDRWRQILKEADRIQEKHLLTLQEGVSEAQFREMVQANVKLVVPEPLLGKYPSAIRNDILTLESFLADLRLLTI